MPFTVQGDILLRDRTTQTLQTVDRGLGRLTQSIGLFNSRTAGLARQGGLLGRISGGAGGLALGAGTAALGALGLGLTIREVGQFAFEMSALNTRLTNSETALTKFAGGADAAEGRIRAIRDALPGAITRLEAINIANQGAALGFGKTTDELERVTKLAAQVSTVFGGELTPTIENMAAAAANLSFVRLDTLGISADKTRERFQELRAELGDTEAFMRAMLEEGERTFEGIVPEVGPVENYTRAWGDLRQEVSRTAGPLGDALASRGAAALDDVTRALSGVRDGTGKVNQELKAAEDRFDRMTEFVQMLKDEFGANVGDMPVFTDAVMRAETARIAVNLLRQELGFLRGDFQAGIGGGPEGLLLAGQSTLAGVNSGPRKDDLRQQIRMDVAADRRRVEAQEDLAQQALDLVDAQFRYERAVGSTSEQLNIMEQRLARTTPGTAEALDLEREIALLRRQEETERTTAQREYEREQLKSIKEVEKAWKDSIAGIAGIPGQGQTSVTQDQLDRAAAGIPQNFPDDFLRISRDELVNGVDRPGVSRGLVEQLVGASTGLGGGVLGGLSGGMLSDLLDEEFSSGRLFSTGIGQSMIGDLINVDAIRAEQDRLASGESGLGFVDQYLRSQLGEGGGLLGGLTTPGAAPPVDRIISEGVAGQDLSTELAGTLEESWTSSDFLEGMAGVGESWIKSALGGAITFVEGGPPELDRLASVLLAELLAAVTGGEEGGEGEAAVE